MVRKVPPGALARVLAEEIESITDRAKGVIYEAGQVGVDTTREYISTRGTPQSGKAGRIESRDMLNSVDFRVPYVGKDTLRLIYGLGRGPKYSRYQEYGFENARSGQWVEGMFAVTDSVDAVRHFLAKRLRSI